jgi:hypothetical protein
MQGLRFATSRAAAKAAAPKTDSKAVLKKLASRITMQALEDV